MVKDLAAAITHLSLLLPTAALAILTFLQTFMKSLLVEELEEDEGFQGGNVIIISCQTPVVIILRIMRSNIASSPDSGLLPRWTTHLSSHSSASCHHLRLYEFLKTVTTHISRALYFACGLLHHILQSILILLQFLTWLAGS